MRSVTTQDIQGAQPKKQIILPRSRQCNNSNTSSINLSTGEQTMAIPASPLKNIQNFKDINSNNTYATQAVIAQPNNDFLQQQLSPSNYQPISVKNNNNNKKINGPLWFLKSYFDFQLNFHLKKRIKPGYPQVDSIRALFASEGSSSNNRDVRQINLNMVNNNSNLNLNYKTIGTSSGEQEDITRMQGVIKTNPDVTGRQSLQPNHSNERPRNSNNTQSSKNSTSRNNGLFEGAQRMRSDLDRSQQESLSQQHSAGKMNLAQKPWEQVPMPDGNDTNNGLIELSNNQSNNITNPRLSNNSQVSSSRLPVQQGVINLFEQKIRNSSQNNISNHGNSQQLACVSGQLSNSAVSFELQKTQNAMSKSAAPMVNQNLTEQDLAFKRKTDDFTNRQRENFHHTNTNSITSSNVIPDQDDGFNQQQNGGFYGDTSPKISLIPVEMPRLLSEGKKIVEKRTHGSRQTTSNSNTNRLRSPQDSLRQKLAQLTSNMVDNGNTVAGNNGDKKDNKKFEKLNQQQLLQQNSPSWQSTAKEHRIIVLCESSNLTREWIHRFLGMRNISNYEVFSFPGGPGCLVLSGDDSERDSWRTVLGIFIKNLSKVYQIQEIQVFMNATSIFSQIYGKDEGKNTVSSLPENLKLACSYIKDTQNALPVKGFVINQKGIIDKIV